MYSNSGAKEICDKTYELESQERNRNFFELNLYQEILQRTFHKGDQAWLSTLISNNLIDHFIPFLPLKREHVKLCVDIELEKKNVTRFNCSNWNECLDEIASQLVYQPDDKWYSTSGCKNVYAKVGLWYEKNKSRIK